MRKERSVVKVLRLTASAVAVTLVVTALDVVVVEYVAKRTVVLTLKKLPQSAMCMTYLEYTHLDRCLVYWHTVLAFLPPTILMFVYIASKVLEANLRLLPILETMFLAEVQLASGLEDILYFVIQLKAPPQEFPWLINKATGYLARVLGYRTVPLTILLLQTVILNTSAITLTYLLEQYVHRRGTKRRSLHTYVPIQ
ncbi:MAG: hypothetical protein DRJ40_00160 [Thermoprotei archaeon]|nr:MAG: hypothetical protein DRJ40_00160 [Thermoprotei archaeon]